MNKLPCFLLMIMKTCILTVIKDEQLYLDYWLKYHLDQGIDHIYVVEDIYSTSHKDITDKYDSVTLLKFDDIFIPEYACIVKDKKDKGIFTQNLIFRQALLYLRFAGVYDWCLCIDADEFLTFQAGYDISVLEDFKTYDAVTLQWKNYGANGLVHTPDYSTPITEIYTKECGNIKCDSHFTSTIKTFRNMRVYSNSIYGCSHCSSSTNWCKTDFKTENVPCYDRMYLRHYITKSFEEYKNKLQVRGMFNSRHRTINDFFVYNPDMIHMKDQLNIY